RPRFVEADVPRAADSEELQIESARFLDLALIRAAVGNDLFDYDRAIEHVHVFRADVNQVEQMLAHEAAIALQFERLDREVFVEVERDDVRKRQPFLAVQPDQLGINADWGRAGRQTE